MSSDDLGDEHLRQTYPGPYSSRHPVPTTQRYDRQLEQRAAKSKPTDGPAPGDVDPGLSRVSANEDNGPSPGHNVDGDGSLKQPYPSFNQNQTSAHQEHDQSSYPRVNEDERDQAQAGADLDGHQSEGGTLQSIKDGLSRLSRPRGTSAKTSDDRERVVTDPVTHLPVTIHDRASRELDHVPENVDVRSPRSRGARSEHQSAGKDTTESNMEKLFPPPSFEIARAKFARIYRSAITVGLVTFWLMSLLLLAIIPTTHKNAILSTAHWNQDRSYTKLLVLSIVYSIIIFGFVGTFLYVLRGWVDNKVSEVWQEEIWNAERRQKSEDGSTETPESTQWLNAVLASIWPLVNPDLFTSLADKLEDVMQASLPKMVRMVSVQDLGQGSEALRVLGVRNLPAAAAKKTVSINGHLGSNVDSKDKKNSGDSHNEQPTEDEESDSNVSQGLEAEEGEFVNMEVAFAYRARDAGKSFTQKANNAHLYLAFYLPGGIRFPVWVEVRGFVGVLRLRLQIIPDPPFFAVCTLTLLGQPKVDISCVPLTKKGLNIMDLPIVSPFVQKSVDAAMAEYVAPKSLVLDLKQTLSGDPFKKDTVARGVLMVKIKRAWDFKGDEPGILGSMKGSTDPYITISWAKFRKPVWSTRVIIDDWNPVWDETGFILVTPEELDADERLQVILWDSDRSTADDELGEVQVSLKDLVRSPEMNGRLYERQDTLKNKSLGGEASGTLQWSVGYFPKLGILPEQMQQQTEDGDARNLPQLKRKVSERANNKLREAADRDKSSEISKEKVRDLHSIERRMISACPASEDYPSGILSIQIHQADGVELEKLNKSRDHDPADDEEEEEQGDDLPSCYCSLVLNHRLIFRTRTKPKNSNPFFNATTERFIRDWRHAEVIVAVRDSRVHENDPIIGVVHLPLGKLLRERSQVHDRFPLAGGIGYGRLRISMVFRSVRLQLPKQLFGWDYGTLAITSMVRTSDLPKDITSLRLKLRTRIAKCKMVATGDGWRAKKDRQIFLAVQRRYHACLVLEFRKTSVGPDRTAAFAILWLKDIADDEESTVKLPVWKGSSQLERAEKCCETEFGEKIGHVEVPLKFWPGLSGYHKHLFSKDKLLHAVGEVLDCVYDEKEAKENADGDSSETHDSDSDSEEADSVGPSFHLPKHDKKHEDEEPNPLKSFKEFQGYTSKLNRRHRGLMQWQGPRTMKWMKTKMRHAKQHIGDHLHHHDDRNTGVESEV